jgi:hypothetical protein
MPGNGTASGAQAKKAAEPFTLCRSKHLKEPRDECGRSLRKFNIALDAKMREGR